MQQNHKIVGFEPKGQGTYKATDDIVVERDGVQLYINKSHYPELRNAEVGDTVIVFSQALGSMTPFTVRLKKTTLTG